MLLWKYYTSTCNLPFVVGALSGVAPSFAVDIPFLFSPKNLYDLFHQFVQFRLPVHIRMILATNTCWSLYPTLTPCRFIFLAPNQRRLHVHWVHSTTKTVQDPHTPTATRPVRDVPPGSAQRGRLPGVPHRQAQTLQREMEFQWKKSPKSRDLWAFTMDVRLVPTSKQSRTSLQSRCPLHEPSFVKLRITQAMKMKGNPEIGSKLNYHFQKHSLLHLRIFQFFWVSVPSLHRRYGNYTLSAAVFCKSWKLLWAWERRLLRHPRFVAPSSNRKFAEWRLANSFRFGFTPSTTFTFACRQPENSWWRRIHYGEPHVYGLLIPPPHPQESIFSLLKFNKNVSVYENQNVMSKSFNEILLIFRYFLNGTKDIKLLKFFIFKPAKSFIDLFSLKLKESCQVF